MITWTPGALRANDKIRLPDGRIGTICYNQLDGCGGVWGTHDFSHISVTDNDEWPAPDFLLREKAVEARFRQQGHKATMECVGRELERIDEDNVVEDIPDCIYCHLEATHVIRFKGLHITGERYTCTTCLEQGKVPPKGFDFVSAEVV